ncbi:MAG: hypothetical protein AAF198_02485 [Pseudomonadota bacterium]
MDNNSVWNCTMGSWILAVSGGFLIAGLLYFVGDWRAVQAIAIGVVGLLLLGVFLTQAICGENAWGAHPDTSGPLEESDASATAMPAAAVSAPAAKKAAPKKAAPKKAAAKKPATKAAPKKATKPKPPVLFKSRPEQVDDLKLISGVGPKLETTLHDIGVYQFAQVANWKKADIATVDDKLKFKGRIERDDWVAQAKILAKGGDTEFSAKKRK